MLQWLSSQHLHDSSVPSETSMFACLISLCMTHDAGDTGVRHGRPGGRVAADTPGVQHYLLLLEAQPGLCELHHGGDGVLLTLRQRNALTGEKCLVSGVMGSMIGHSQWTWGGDRFTCQLQKNEPKK